jgi:hypothetical protein
MSSRRRFLSATAGLVVGASLKAYAEHSPAVIHPDTELLALCAQLEEMRDEWQRLYDATSDEDAITTPADRAWQEYSNHVWPLVYGNSFTAPPGVVDVPARLLTLRATPPRGPTRQGRGDPRDG